MILVNVEALKELINEVAWQSLIGGVLLGLFSGLALAAIATNILLRKELHTEPKQLKLLGVLYSLTAFFLSGHVGYITWIFGKFETWVQALFIVFFVWLAYRMFARAKRIAPKRQKEVKDSPTQEKPRERGEE